MTASATRRLARAVALVALAVACALPASASPVSCASPCVVHATGVGYLTPVVEIESGSSVLWKTNEVASHPTTDSADPFTQCFFALVGYEDDSGPVRFDVEDGQLWATNGAGTPYETSAPCTTAVPVAQGAFALRFFCIVHPWMNGSIVVEPSVV